MNSRFSIQLLKCGETTLQNTVNEVWIVSHGGENDYWTIPKRSRARGRGGIRA